MYKIILPLDYNGIRYGVEFARGIGHTDNSYIAKLMKGKGFEVEKVEAAEASGSDLESGSEWEKKYHDEVAAHVATKELYEASLATKEDIVEEVRVADLAEEIIVETDASTEEAQPTKAEAKKTRT